MEREPLRHQDAEREHLRRQDAEREVPAKARPAAEVEEDTEAARRASEQQLTRAAAAQQRAPKSDEVARAETQQVLSYIKSEAAQRATVPVSIDTSGAFYARLRDHYLKEYLEKPSPETGKQAVSKISPPLGKNPRKDDFWEATAKDWGEMEIPAGMRAFRSKMPPKMGAATEILSAENRKQLPYIDAPHLVGAPNPGTDKDSDVTGGKNISQLMHWGTGVKYANEDPRSMREMFLAYEYLHLEGWDVFGEDPINDLISEDAGRIMGRQLQSGELDDKNLHAKLDAGWNEGRAWVGTLLRSRQAQFDAWIALEQAKPAKIWWQWDRDIWGADTIFTQLKSGHTIEEVQRWAMTERIIGMYQLIYYAEIWEQEHGEIQNSRFIEAMLGGKFDQIMTKSVKGEPLDIKDKMTGAFYMGVE